MFEKSNIFKSGKIGEEIIIKYLELIKNEKIKIISLNKYFDVMTNNEIMYEIKTQYHTIKSGWVALEFQTFNKPSGIETTTSNIFIYLIPDLEKDIFYIYEIETNILKSFIKDNNLKIGIKKSIDHKDKIKKEYEDKYYKIYIEDIKKISFFFYEINEQDLNYKSFKCFFYECKQIRKNININHKIKSFYTCYFLISSFVLTFDCFLFNLKLTILTAFESVKGLKHSGME